MDGLSSWVAVIMTSWGAGSSAMLAHAYGKQVLRSSYSLGKSLAARHVWQNSSSTCYIYFYFFFGNPAVRELFFKSADSNRRQ